MPQGSEEEVALIVLKRPPVTEKKIEEIEVLMFVTCPNLLSYGGFADD